MNAFITRWIAPFWLQIAIAAATDGWGLAATFKVQIEGLRIWPIHIVGWREENGTLKLDLDTIKAAQVVAGERAAAAKAETERHFRDAAERAEHDHAIELDRARTTTAAFIARNRVRAKAIGGAPGHSPAPGEGDGSAVPSDAADAALVAVSERDVEIAGDNYVYARKAYDLFQDLIAKGLAEPAKPFHEGLR